MKSHTKEKPMATIVLLALLQACHHAGPDQPPIQLSVADVTAAQLPCRSGPCPPVGSCPTPPPCDPQFLVSASVRMHSMSEDVIAVQSLTAELYDVHGVRAGLQEPPGLPLAITARETDLGLSFLTLPGAEVRGGTIRLAVAGIDSRGSPWHLKTESPVPRS